jgi:2-dehydro-3-deoxygluconokinase
VKIRAKNEVEFDEISLGEVMLRLDPGDLRIRTTRNFSVWEGGGEYNVARGLAKCFGLKTSVITGLAENEVGKLISDLILMGWNFAY